MEKVPEEDEQCLGRNIKWFLYYPKIWVSYSPEAETIFVLNAIAAGLHLASAAAIIGISASRVEKVYDLDLNIKPLGPYVPAICYKPPTEETRPDFYIENQDVFTTRSYLQFIVISFFLLSAGFQMIPLINRGIYIKKITSNGCNTLRYVEYSISASVMIVGLACLVSVYDLYTHLLLFVTSFLCMMLGLAADHIRCIQKQIREYTGYSRETEPLMQGDTHPVQLVSIVENLHVIKWALHWLGWVAIIVPYVFVLLFAFFVTAARGWDCFEGQTFERKMPDWIYAAVILQLILFSAFGAVQTRQFTNDNKPNIGLLTEFHFVFLSLLSKTLLGWLVASNLLFV